MPKQPKILETYTCPCGATVNYENPCRGAVNLADFRLSTGWCCIFDSMVTSIWTCPTCAAAAREHAEAILEILGSEYVNLSSLLSIKPRDQI
jgi:hypothetical protein